MRKNKSCFEIRNFSALNRNRIMRCLEIPTPTYNIIMVKDLVKVPLSLVFAAGLEKRREELLKIRVREEKNQIKITDITYSTVAT